MRKFLPYICVFLLILTGILIYNYQTHTALLATSFPVKPTPWQPLHLRIPSLQIDTPVLNVGTTTNGQMDAPTSQAVNSPYWSSVFWYAPGTAPGQNGNAVIAGHVDRVGGDPAIFWSLHTMKPHDLVIVQTQGKGALKFAVDRVVKYPANAPGKAILNAVFGPTSGHHLNLITCSGVWTGQGYDERLVVFTTQVNS
ncbi:hypothetical protein KSF_018040 [Reticulibacter mediterranei]|uniref:Class F sortase n=1 Tax=Reticulibacter mediterranei TaxID=2778369 RepID=A0A8J3IKC5_9CHLR|nr:class F sortase [Reticulibacter mediterranei]GHO91756.1 hypothetical protein KSF_018040 [Reticulibacter mediterranei]